MAWGNCPTHGPIQDAKEKRIGKPYEKVLYCKCGLLCADYSPEGWVDPSELFNEKQRTVQEELQAERAEALALAQAESIASLDEAEKAKAKPAPKPKVTKTKNKKKAPVKAEAQEEE